MQKVGILVDNILKPILKDYSPILLILKKHWDSIIGIQYYKYCEVEKVSFMKDKKKCGTLYIKIFNSSTTFYINNNKQNIIDRANVLFGYTLLNKISIKQEPRIII